MWLSGEMCYTCLVDGLPVNFATSGSNTARYVFLRLIILIVIIIIIHLPAYNFFEKYDN